MADDLNDVEVFWAHILSEEPEKVRRAYLSLSEADERDAVRRHLHIMATEEGWTALQQQAAAAALKIIQ